MYTSFMLKKSLKKTCIRCHNSNNKIILMFYFLDWSSECFMLPFLPLVAWHTLSTHALSYITYQIKVLFILYMFAQNQSLRLDFLFLGKNFSCFNMCCSMLFVCFSAKSKWLFPQALPLVQRPNPATAFVLSSVRVFSLVH